MSLANPSAYYHSQINTVQKLKSILKLLMASGIIIILFKFCQLNRLQAPSFLFLIPDALMLYAFFRLWSLINISRKARNCAGIVCVFLVLSMVKILVSYISPTNPNLMTMDNRSLVDALLRNALIWPIMGCIYRVVLSLCMLLLSFDFKKIMTNVLFSFLIVLSPFIFLITVTRVADIDKLAFYTITEIVYWVIMLIGLGILFQVIRQNLKICQQSADSEESGD